MRKNISRVALIVYVFMLLFSSSALSSPGGRVPLGLIMIIFAIPPVVAGPKKYRIIGVIALVLAVVATVGDYQAGKRFRARLDGVRVQADQQGEKTKANQASEPIGAAAPQVQR